MVAPRVHDQDDLLPEMVKCDYLVEQHQVYILKALFVICVQHKGRLGVFDVIVGKIPDEPAGKGRQVFHTRAAVIREHLPYDLFRVLCFHRDGGTGPQGEHAVCTAQLQRGVKPKKRVPAPHAAALRRFEQVAVAADIFQLSQCFHGGDPVSVQLAADWDDFEIARLRQPFCF